PFTISQVNATNINNVSTHITWATNVSATSRVFASVTSPVSRENNSLTASSDVLVTNHDLLLSGLTASTKYYYVVVSRDASNNEVVSQEYTFTTHAVGGSGLVISNVAVSNTMANSVRITWTTNVPAN